MQTVQYHRIALLSMLLGACGGAAAPRPAAAPLVLGPMVEIPALEPYFFPGESIVWKVTYAGVEGGRARLAVGAPGEVDGRNVVILTAQAESSGLFAAIKQVKDDVTSWIDVASGQPVRTEGTTSLGGPPRTIEATYANGYADLKVTRQDKERKRRIRLRGAVTHDALSSLLMIRAWNAPVGARGHFWTLGSSTLWSTELTVQARETVDTPFGERAALRISGVSTRTNRANKKPRTFTVWLTDDEQRIPVRIVASTEYGDIVVTAEAYSRPQ